jgi:hydrogenase maturation protease
MRPGIVVFAVGNRSRGDDALAPLLLERLEPWLAAQSEPGAFDLIEEYQLQIEHALDLQGKRLALFIDAGVDTPGPFRFYPVAPGCAAATSSSHELSPQGVLEVYRQYEGVAPPPSFVLCVRGERFGLGEGLSAQARVHAEAAWRHLTELCRQPEAALWCALAANPGPGAA